MTWGVLQTQQLKKPLQPQEKETVGVGAKIYPIYPQKLVHGLGAGQIICGLLAFVLSIVHLHMAEDRMTLRHDVGTAVGVLFIVTGVVVVLSGFARTKGLILTASVMSGLACLGDIAVAIGWVVLGLLRYRCPVPGRFDPDDDIMYPDDSHEDSHERHPPMRGHKGRGKQEEMPLVHRRDPEHVLEPTEWVLLVVFFIMVICCIVVVVQGIRALKKRPAEGEARETQVFVITPEKGAVLS